MVQGRWEDIERRLGCEVKSLADHVAKVRAVVGGIECGRVRAGQVGGH